MRVGLLSEVAFSAIVLVVLLFGSIIAPPGQKAVFGNGGPIDGGHIEFAGGIRIKDTSAELLHEKLDVQIIDDSAKVRIIYTLTNPGSAVEVEYGFPFLLDQTDTNFDESEIRNFRILLNGRPQSVESIKRPFTSRIEDDHKLRKLYWKISNLTIPGHKKSTLEISYTARNYYSDFGVSKTFLPGFGTRSFQYDLSPARGWKGSEHIDLNFRLDLSDLSRQNASIRSLIIPFPYERKGSVITAQVQNLNINSALPLTLEYENSNYKLSEFFKETALRSGVTIRVSSQLGPDYGAENLIDGNPRTVWCEGVPGIGKGQWIEIEFPQEVSIAYIGIIAGVPNSKQLYIANPRIRRLRLLEKRSSTELIEESGTEYSLRDLDYNFTPEAFFPMVSELVDKGDSFNKSKTIRFEILDVFPGSEYEDTCIAEIFTLGRN
ncbi:MAG: discoidin domain-containing protein [Leptospiraceae bacterium]